MREEAKNSASSRLNVLLLSSLQLNGTGRSELLQGLRRSKKVKTNSSNSLRLRNMPLWPWPGRGDPAGGRSVDTKKRQKNGQSRARKTQILNPLCLPLLGSQGKASYFSGLQLSLLYSE